MYSILHDLHIKAKPSEVFSLISTSRGLNKWWTLESQGDPEINSEYRFHFGPDYDWSGKVTGLAMGQSIEWTMLECDEDWNDTIVGFDLSNRDNGTQVRFSHTNWKENNEHYRRSNYCWAIYLRLLKRYIEHDEFIPYDHRNNA